MSPEQLRVQRTRGLGSEAAAVRLSLITHWFYNIIGCGGRALPAPVAGLHVDPLHVCPRLTVF
jgi:hypothetical protein